MSKDCLSILYNTCVCVSTPTFGAAFFFPPHLQSLRKDDSREVVSLRAIFRYWRNWPYFMCVWEPEPTGGNYGEAEFHSIVDLNTDCTGSTSYDPCSSNPCCFKTQLYFQPVVGNLWVQKADCNYRFLTVHNSCVL